MEPKDKLKRKQKVLKEAKARSTKVRRPAKASATSDKPPFTMDTVVDKLRSINQLSVGSKQFVLFIGDDGAILILIQSGRVSRRLYAPSPAPEHVLPFLELLRVNPRVPISIMLDMMDQSYVRHTFPPVSPLTIKKLVSRRMDRDFSAEDIRGSLLIGRDSDGRREWNYLLISVANSTMIQQWTELVVELPNQMLGMYLVPIEAQHFITDLAKLSAQSPAMRASWRLMVCHDKVSGYRQVVLKDGHLVFTRLTQASSDTTADVMAAALEQEIMNTIEYLRRLSYNDQAGLEVYVIVADEIKALMKNDRINATVLRCYSPFEVSELMKLDQAALSGDRFADVVLAASFGMGGKRKLRLMPPYAQKLMMLYQSSKAIKIATALILLMMTYFIVSGFIDAAEVKIDINKANQDKGRAVEDIEKAEKVLGGLGAMQGEVLNVATLYGSVLQKRPLPLDFVRSMAKVVNDNRLVYALDWRFESEATPASGGSKAPVTGTKSAGNEQIVARVEFKISGHGGEKKNFIELAYRLLGDVKAAFEGYSVENDRLPGVINNNESLSLNFDESEKDSRMEDTNAIVVVRIKGPIPATPDAAPAKKGD